MNIRHLFPIYLWGQAHELETWRWIRGDVNRFQTVEIFLWSIKKRTGRKSETGT